MRSDDFTDWLRSSRRSLVRMRFSAGLDVGHAVPSWSRFSWGVTGAPGASSPGNDCSGYQWRPGLPKPPPTWPAGTAFVVQHVTGENCPRFSEASRVAAQRFAKTSPPARPHPPDITSFDATTTTPRPSTRCSATARATSGPYKGIHAELAPSDTVELQARAEALGRAFIDQGITFSLSGQGAPFPLDLVPWSSRRPSGRGSKGIAQRVKALGCTSTTHLATRRSCVTGDPAGW